MPAPDPRFPTTLDLSRWEDPYTLGVFVTKARLPRSTLRIRFLKHPQSQAAQLFRAGTRAAAQTSWTDLAFEMAHLRARDSDTFARALAASLPGIEFHRMMLAIQHAHDWETPTQIRIGHDISKAPKDHTKM